MTDLTRQALGEWLDSRGLIAAALAALLACLLPALLNY
jgi:hypothetical protein